MGDVEHNWFGFGDADFSSAWRGSIWRGDFS
jgi:hypothetical protein